MTDLPTNEDLQDIALDVRDDMLQILEYLQEDLFPNGILVGHEELPPEEGVMKTIDDWEAGVLEWLGEFDRRYNTKNLQNRLREFHKDLGAMLKQGVTL